MKSNSSWLLDIGEVQHRLEVWRKTSRRGQRIPEPLWAAVAVLAGAHGVSLDSLGGSAGLGLGRHGRGVLEASAMIQITPQMRIWLAVEPVDFRQIFRSISKQGSSSLRLLAQGHVLGYFRRDLGGFSGA